MRCTVFGVFWRLSFFSTESIPTKRLTPFQGFLFLRNIRGHMPIPLKQRRLISFLCNRKSIHCIASWPPTDLYYRDFLS
jgi:hypothetical protein